MNKDNLKLYSGIAIAIIFWFLMFSPLTRDMFNFWYIMLSATGTLISYSFVFGFNDLKKVLKFEPKYIVIGIVSAALLYFVFFAGNIISKMLFEFAEHQVTNIYSTKSQAGKFFIGASLLLWIGPAEELFWRGFVQNKMAGKYGSTKSFIITTLVYCLVHIWGFNLMLLVASLICGIFWGWMFMKYKTVLPGLISHAVWDLFIFIIIPLS